MRTLLASAGLTLLLALATQPSVSAQERERSNLQRAACPPGYELIVEVCISKSTGDIVKPIAH